MRLERRMRIVNPTAEAAAAAAIKVAFASNDMRHVNQHFGAAEGFAVYQVDMDNATLHEALQFGQQAQDGNDDKLAAKIALIDGCAAVYCQAVGASAVQQLLLAGIQPVKVSQNAVIAELIEALQQELRSGPSAWLAKAMSRQQRADPTRFSTMAEDAWEE